MSCSDQQHLFLGCGGDSPLGIGHLPHRSSLRQTYSRPVHDIISGERSWTTNSMSSSTHMASTKRPGMDRCPWPPHSTPVHPTPCTLLSRYLRMVEVAKRWNWLASDGVAGGIYTVVPLSTELLFLVMISEEATTLMTWSEEVAMVDTDDEGFWLS